MIDQLNQEATDVLIRKSAAMVKASIEGSDAYPSLYNDLLRLHPLCGYMKELNLYEAEFWIGDNVVTWPSIEEVRSKIQSFNDGIDLDVSGLPTGGTDGGGGGTVPAGTIVYRAGVYTSLVGVVEVLFTVGGALAPMPSTSYYLNCFLITSDGTKQTNLGVITKTTNGFTASDVLAPGVIHYEAILLT